MLTGLTTTTASADQIDDLLGRIAIKNSNEARIKALYNSSTTVGKMTIPTTEQLKYSVGTSVDSKRAQSLVWHELAISGQQKDMTEDGERRRVVAVSIRNVSRYAADGPNIILSQFWINGSTSLDDAPADIRLSSLENKSVSLDSVPNKGFFKTMLAKITSKLQVIANFYGTYHLRYFETRVVYLKEPVFVESVQMKAVATANTPNNRGVVEVKFLFE
jgi:hypothetical protein